MRFGHSANLVISMDDPREKEREERREGERGADRRQSFERSRLFEG